MALALLAPGSRTSSTNATRPCPISNGGEAREFQLNLDGQQISSELGAGNQPRFSQDSIAEFQFISNRFDATQGRSTGVQVNAITKSGTNRLSGLFRTQLPRQQASTQRTRLAHQGRARSSNQQSSTAVGGPIVKDKLHYFGNFEYERNPLHERLEHAVSGLQHRADGEDAPGSCGGDPPRLSALPADALDGQGRPDTRTTSRLAPGRRPAIRASTSDNDERNEEYIGQFTQVLSNRALNEVKGGYSHFGFTNELLTEWSKHWQAPRVTNGHPRITFTGFSIAGNANYRRGIATRRCGSSARRLHVLVRRARPPRPEGWAANSSGISRTARTATIAAARSTPTTASFRADRSRRCFPIRSTPTPGISRRSRRTPGPTRSASGSSRFRTRSRSTRLGCRTTGASAAS